MLSFQQFIAKHPVKYTGLSQAQKRKRYQDYVRSVSNVPAPTTNRRGRARRAPRQVQGDSAMSAYLKMVADPFTSDTAGVPAFPSPPSTKITSWCRGTCTVGTAGFGFVAVVPTAASDVNGVFYSTSAYTGTILDTTVGTGLVGSVFSNLPFAAASFTESGVRVRFATVGLRVRYIGSDNNLSGFVIPIVSPLHQPLNSYTISTLQSLENYKSCATSREWCAAILTPATRRELDYHHFHQLPLDHDDVTGQTGIMAAIAISGTAGNSYEFEVVQHIEFVSFSALMTRTETGVRNSIEPILSRLNEPTVTNRGYNILSRAARGMERLADIVPPARRAVPTLIGLYNQAVRQQNARRNAMNALADD